MTEVTRLKEGDWKEIFNISLFTIGSTELPIKALVLEDLADVCAMIGKASDVIIQKTAIFQDKSKSISEKIEVAAPVIAKVIANDFPEIVQKMSGLHIDDIKKLPAPIQVELALKCVEVNLESMESLAKNLQALMEKAVTLSQSVNNMGKEAKEEQVATIK